MAVDASQIAQLDVAPGELPATMAAWVIREERLGEPLDAFQIEEIEVPEPGAFEVTVRVMAAGVNFNNVWAALGQPVSVFRYHAEDHHIGGSDASGIVWKVGEGVTRFKPGDEVVVHCNQASYEDVEVHGLDPLAAPSQQIWGYETTWGSFAQFCLVQAQQLLPKPANLTWEEAASYGLTYFTAYRMLIDQAKLQSGHRVLIWGAAGGLGVFATQLCRLVGADSVGVVSSAGKGELVQALGAAGVIDRNDFAGMMRRGDETDEEERARFKESRRFSKLVAEMLGGQPDIVFEHVGRATFPTSVLAVRPFGKVVICGATSGYNLDFDVRYLWMRQKQIIGSHFANAWECTKANELVEAGKIRPVLWKTMGFDDVAEAHQLMRDNKHLGKIAILVGARGRGPRPHGRGPGGDPSGGGRLMAAGVVNIPWYATLFRGDRFAEALGEIAPVALRYGASDYTVYRAQDDPLQVHASLDLRAQARLRALLVRRGVHRLALGLLELVPGAGRLRLADAGHLGAGRRRHRRGADHGRDLSLPQAGSSGAIVSPASESCSQ